MQRKVGIREAKAKLSHYIDLAQRGDDVVLTDRGKPVVRLVAIAPEKPSEAQVLRQLAYLGITDAADKRPQHPAPIRAKKAISISRVVRDMRR